MKHSRTVKQLPYLLVKIRPENFQVEYSIGPQDLQYAKRCIWEPEVCLHLLLLDLEQALSFSVESSFTAHTSAQPSVTYRISAVCPSNKEMEKEEKSEVHHTTTYQSESNRKNTTKENCKGRNLMCSSHWKKGSICFIIWFILILPFVTYKERKKKKKASNQLSSSYHCGFYGYRSECCNHGAS